MVTLQVSEIYTGDPQSAGAAVAAINNILEMRVQSRFGRKLRKILHLIQHELEIIRSVHKDLLDSYTRRDAKGNLVQVKSRTDLVDPTAFSVQFEELLDDTVEVPSISMMEMDGMKLKLRGSTWTSDLLDDDMPPLKTTAAMGMVQIGEIFSVDQRSTAPAMAALNELLAQSVRADLGRKLRDLSAPIAKANADARQRYDLLRIEHAKKDANGEPVPVNSEDDLADLAAFRAAFEVLVLETFEVPLLSFTELDTLGIQLRGATWASSLINDDLVEEDPIVEVEEPTEEELPYQTPDIEEEE